MNSFIRILMLSYLLSFPVVSQTINSSYTEIEEKIAVGKLDEALKETEEELTEHPADAKLSLYQAKIWVEKGEALYKQRKFKSAFAYYQKAYKVWQTHPVVWERYHELKGKELRDAPGFNSTNRNYSNKQDSPAKFNSPESNKDLQELKEAVLDLKKKLGETKDQDKSMSSFEILLVIVLFSITLSNFALVFLLFKSSTKKDS